MKTLTLKAEEMPWMDRFCRSGLFGTLKIYTQALSLYLKAKIHFYSAMAALISA